MNLGLRSCAIRTAHLAVAALIATAAQGAPLVLSCKVESGAGSPDAPMQIMIDEEKGIVIYNYQWVGPNPKKQVNVDGRHGTIDQSMKVTANNSKFLVASSFNGTFVITKEDARFAYAYAMPFPSNAGNWIALGNTHMGSCVKSPFN
jgi:hypothetical protein